MNLLHPLGVPGGEAKLEAFLIIPLPCWILMLSLHLLQVSLVYEHVDDSAGVGGACLARPSHGGDFRALSPLKWQHINPYGTFILNMKERLPLEPVISATGATLPKFRASLG